VWDIAGVVLKNNYNITHIYVYSSQGVTEKLPVLAVGSVTTELLLISAEKLLLSFVRQVTPFSCRGTSYSF
jgi:hypothetical protein